MLVKLISFSGGVLRNNGKNAFLSVGKQKGKVKISDTQAD